VSQGANGQTPRKEQGFAAILSVCLEISMTAKVARFPYWHLDCNAGSGFNPVAGCEGSPLVFLRQAIALRRRVWAYFCDENREACQELASRLQPLTPELAPGSLWRIFPGDNADFLGKMTRVIFENENRPKEAMGSCLVDPNGWYGFPFAALATFADLFKKIDLVLNINAWMFQRVRQCKASSNEIARKGFVDWPDLEDIPAALSRPNWFIRNPVSLGRGHHFVTLLGTSLAERKAHTAIGLYPLGSSVGLRIMRTLAHVEPDERYLPFPEPED